MKLDRTGLNKKVLAIFTTATLLFGASAFFLEGENSFTFEGKDITSKEENGKYLITSSNGDTFEVTAESLQEKVNNKELEMGLNTYELSEGEICTLDVEENIDFKTNAVVGSFLVMFVSGMKIFSDCLDDIDRKTFYKRNRQYC